MSVTIECPSCGKRYTVDASASGRTAVCQACGTRMQIPSLEPAAQPQEPAAELPRQMMANRAVAGRTCPVCHKPIELGQAVRNCELCSATHHDACWQSHKGCGTPQCDNAPLPELGFAPGDLEPPPAAGAAPPGTKPCPHCGEPIADAAVKCRHCLEYLPGHGPPTPAQHSNSTLAVASLVCGIISIVFCCMAVVAGPAAIVLGVMARREIERSNGKLAGDGMALAGIITGSIGTLFGAGLFLLQIIGALAQA